MSNSQNVKEKDIQRMYFYFDRQDAEKKKELLDYYLDRRRRSDKSVVEFKGYPEKTLKELCQEYSSSLQYTGEEEECDEKCERQMVSDIYISFQELYEREKGGPSYANLRGQGGQGGKRRNRNKTKKYRKNKRGSRRR